MSTKAKHTPVPKLPFKTNGSQVFAAVLDADGFVVARCNSRYCEHKLDECGAISEFIVLACNAHEDVVKALEAFFEWYDKPSVDGDLVLAAELLRAALAKARGE